MSVRLALLAIAACLVHTAAAHVQKFAIIGDWGGPGGAGDPHVSHWQPGPKSCPTGAGTPFYWDMSAGDAPCVAEHCGKYVDGTDQRENCIRTLQQWQSAYLFNEVCAKEDCEFVINTSDNFYMDGCNKTAGVWGDDCNGRFQKAFLDVYHTDATPALKDRTWYGSLGNHDILGYTEGVNEQIALTRRDKRWYMPARWYSKTIGGQNAWAVHLVVLHSSCLIDGYLAPGSAYGVTDEEQACSTPAARKAQLGFAESELKKAKAKPGWTFVVMHHPPYSGDESYFEANGVGTAPESAAWAKLKSLIAKYKPDAVFSGHDHALTYTAPPEFDTRFIVSGAASYSEPNDGGWNQTSNNVRITKPWLLYSNTILNQSPKVNGEGFSGFVHGEVTSTIATFKFYSMNTGTEAQYSVTCAKKSAGGLSCINRAGPARPNYVQPKNYPHGLV